LDGYRRFQLVLLVFVLAKIAVVFGYPYFFGPDSNRPNAYRSDGAPTVAELRNLAEQGHAMAQHNLGVRYFEGQDLPQDYLQAEKWYRLAAEQGLVESQTNLAMMYMLGHGVARDLAEAARWYRMAAWQGDAVAQVNLGALYTDGDGVRKDDAEAARWFRKAAIQGLP
jgi:hypothetical protein